MNENHRKSLAKDFRFIIVLIGICSLTGFLEPIVPLLDLFNHFRLQAVIGAVVCIICSIFLKDRPAIFLACAVLALNITAIGYKLHRTSGIPEMSGNQASFSIISSNVLTSNTDYQSVMDMVSKQKPDIVVFSEVDDTWIKHLQTLENVYPHKLLFPRPDNFGLAAFSKKPFEGEVKNAGGAELPILSLRFNDFTVLVAHPLPPASMHNMDENRAYISEVASISDAIKGPVIVAGDMNATLWSATINPLIDTGFKRINPLGIAYTWPKGNWAYALQIDHFFAKGISAANFTVLPAVGSDHYPIRADILLK